MKRGFLTLLVVLGCSLTGSGCSSTSSIVVDGVSRGYILHAPAQLATEPMPLLIALHQFTDSPKGMERLSGFDAVADREKFLVVYPKGLHRGWNVDDHGDKDVTFLLALIDTIATQYAIDPARIYATGISAGGVMAQYLAGHSSRIAAIAPVSGSLDKTEAAALMPERAVPVLLIHGTADPVIPFAGGPTFAGPFRPKVDFLSAPDNAAWWAHVNGCGDATTEKPLAINGTPIAGATQVIYSCPAAQVSLLILRDGGHTWAGHDNCYPAFIVGHTFQGLDASEVIWQFFQDKRL